MMIMMIIRNRNISSHRKRNPHPVQIIKYIVVQEDIAKGQRVESFRITAARDEVFLKSVKLYG